MTDRESFGIDGKVAIVAGGGSRAEGIGNGRAAAILLARAGAKALVADFNLANAEATVEMIRAEGGEASAHQTDATEADSCREMVEAAMARYGRLDILDNNVGIGSRGSVVDRGNRLGHRQSGSVPGLGTRALHHWPDSSRRWRCHPGRSQTRLSGGLR